MSGNRNLIRLAGFLLTAAAIVTSCCATTEAQTETVLFSFGAPPAPSAGGTNPSGKLVFDAKGNLYGTTTYGGHSNNCEGSGGQTSCGVAFQLTPKAGGVWTEKILHTFTNNGTDGTFPGGMIFDAAGNLYGTTSAGGPYGEGLWYFGGTAFELSPEAGGKWTEKILYNFEGGVGIGVGDSPSSSLIFDAAGNLYGTTVSGGSGTGHNSLGCGSVFELSPNTGGSWTASALYTFMDETDGCAPGGLIRNNAGNIFGTSFYGKFGYGEVFELMPGSGGAWTDVNLVSFGNDGPDDPNSVAFDSQGNIYATACSGQGFQGLYKYGSVFELTPGTGGTWTYNLLYTFKGATDGSCPTSLAVNATGVLYGITAEGGADADGTVFELKAGGNGVWTKTTLHSFSGGTDGSSPSSLTLASSGDLFGTTLYGGVYNGGTVFKVVP
jgi:uncharacterized repeat protein (TIGR03803 family)